MAWLYLHELHKELEDFNDEKDSLREEIKEAAIKIRDLKQTIEHTKADVENGEFNQDTADAMIDGYHEDIGGLRTQMENAIENLQDIERDDNYAELKRVISEIEDYSTDRYTALIPCGREFEDYVREYCEDVGLVGKDPHDLIVIDWEATAENFKENWVEISYDGEDYMLEAR